MKNRIVRALLAAMLTVSMVAGSGVYVSAASITKDETVYVKTDENGKEKSVIVSEQLRNIDKSKKIDDISKLMDIENVKGDEVYQKSGDKIVWENDGSNDICYQGTSKEKTPVGIKLSYELDGKAVKAEDLKGKSGHLTVQVDYTNETSKEKYVPFLMTTAVVMKGEGYSNITVENGKLISDGDKSFVLGYGIPGLKEYLQVDDSEFGDVDVQIPEGFSMELDVEDYDGITCMSLATSDVFANMENDKIEDVDDLKKAMSDLEDASSQLMSGTALLKDGIDTLLSSSSGLVDGVNALDEGGKALANGSKTLTNGSKELKDGATSLHDGISQLAAGSLSLAKGAKQISDGTVVAKAGADQLNDGLGQLQQGASGMKQQASDGISQLDNGAGSLVGGLSQAKTGADQITNGIAGAQSAMQQLEAGIGQAMEGVSGISQLAQGIIDTESSMPQTIEVPIDAVYVDNSDIRAAVAGTLAASGVDEGTIAAAVGCIQDKTAGGGSTTVDISAYTGGGIGYAQQIIGAASGVNGGLTTVSGGAAQIDGALGTLGSGAAGLANSLSADGALGSGASSLQNGIKTMGQSLGQGTEALINAASQLHAGSQQLSDGLAELKDGTSQVSDGANELNLGLGTANVGAGKLEDGSSALWNGAGTLSAGSEELSAGLDTLNNGSGQLVEGITALDNGAGELNDGMIKFNDEGISKITSLFGDDLDTIFTKFNDMIENAAQYTSYAGKTDDMEGNVKFIFMTE